MAGASQIPDTEHLNKGLGRGLELAAWGYMAALGAAGRGQLDTGHPNKGLGRGGGWNWLPGAIWQIWGGLELAAGGYTAGASHDR